jgi:hypothetical protein
MVKETEKSTFTIDKEELTKYLNKCDRKFLDTLILTFGDDGVKQLEYTHSSKAKRELACELMCPENDEAKFLMVKEYYDLIDMSEEDIQGAKDDLKKARKEYQETMDEYKSKLESRVEELRTKFKIENHHIQAYEQIKGKKREANLVKKGLKAYATARTIAKRNGQEDQLIASAEYLATQAAGMAKDTDVSDKSLQAVSKSIRTFNKGINQYINEVLDENGKFNAKANSLAIEAKTKVKQAESNGAQQPVSAG